MEGKNWTYSLMETRGKDMGRRGIGVKKKGRGWVF
jgi:hypothetical protein